MEQVQNVSAEVCELSVRQALIQRGLQLAEEMLRQVLIDADIQAVDGGKLTILQPDTQVVLAGMVEQLGAAAQEVGGDDFTDGMGYEQTLIVDHAPTLSQTNIAVDTLAASAAAMVADVAKLPGVVVVSPA